MNVAKVSTISTWIVVFAALFLKECMYVFDHCLKEALLCNMCVTAFRIAKSFASLSRMELVERNLTSASSSSTVRDR